MVCLFSKSLTNLAFQHYCLPLNASIHFAPTAPFDEKFSRSITWHIQTHLPSFVWNLTPLLIFIGPQFSHAKRQEQSVPIHSLQATPDFVISVTFLPKSPFFPAEVPQSAPLLLLWKLPRSPTAGWELEVPCQYHTKIHYWGGKAPYSPSLT